MELESSQCQSINLQKCEGKFVKLCKKMNVLLRHTKCKHPHFDILEAIPNFRTPSTLLPHSIRASAVGAQSVVLSMTLQKYFSHRSLII